MLNDFIKAFESIAHRFMESVLKNLWFVNTLVKASIGTVKEKWRMKVSNVPDIDKWRIDYLARLLRERGEAFYRAEEEEVTRLTTLIDSLCVN